MNVLLFKSRCNIFIGFGIIKELPGLVGSATPCTRQPIHVFAKALLPWKSSKYYIFCVCVCVCVALFIQHADYTVSRELSPRCIINGTIVGGD